MNRSFRCVLLIAVLLLAFGAQSVNANQRARGLDAWKIVSYQSLVNREWAIQNTFMAPDGFHIGYEKEEALFCSHNLLTDEEQCADVPREMGRLVPDSWYVPLEWSPTVDRVIVTGVPYRFMRDTDLTVLSLASGESSVLVPDQYEGTIFPLDKPTAGTIIDISPAWSHDGKTIAVERVTVSDTDPNRFPPATITLIDAETGEARQLADLPGHQKDWVDMGTTLNLAWSPDDSTIAGSFRHNELNPKADGLWLFDSSSGDATQLLTIPEAQELYQALFPGQEILAITPISWSPDGSRLLFWAGNPGGYPSRPWCFWIDINSNEIAALPLPTHPNDVEQLRMINPHSVAWSPDGSMLLVATREFALLPGESSELIDPTAQLTDLGEKLGIRLVDVASGESVLLGHVPLGPLPIYTAFWGPNNDVLIAGYYLKLAQQ